MLKSIKKNWKFVFPITNNIATLVFSIWGFVTLLTPTDEVLNGIHNFILRLLVAFLLLLFIYACIMLLVAQYAKTKRMVKVLNLQSYHSLFVEYGDLFNCGDPDERKNIAFAGNRCFDTIVDDDLVGSTKIHGIALKRIYDDGQRSQDDVNREIQGNLSSHKYSKEIISSEEKRSGNLVRYEAGAVAEIDGLQNEKYFILGLTYFDRELRACVEKEDYVKAIGMLVKYISDRSQGFPTYLPVIGTGGADVGNVNDIVGFIIKTFELYKDKIDCDIHIVVSEKEEKLGLLNYKMI